MKEQAQMHKKALDKVCVSAIDEIIDQKMNILEHNITKNLTKCIGKLKLSLDEELIPSITNYANVIDNQVTANNTSIPKTCEDFKLIMHMIEACKRS